MTADSAADRRGVSPVVGFILLMGLVAIVVLGVFMVGTSLTGATQQSVEDRQASNSMSELATEIDRLVSGDGDTGTFLIDGSDGSVTDVDPDAGQIEIAIQKGGNRTTVYDEPIGSIQYESGGSTLAYQAGGIWRHEDGSAVLVESPRFDYRSTPSPTLTLPVIKVTGNTSGSGEVDGDLTVANRSEVFPDTTGFGNPLSADRVLIDVQSNYCTAWASYVEGQTDGEIVEQCAETINTSVDELRLELPVANGTEDVTIGTPPVDTTPTISAPSVEDPDAPVEASTVVDEPTVDTPTEGPGETAPSVDPEIDPGEPSDPDEGGVYGLYVENSLQLDSLGGQVQGSIGAGDIETDSSASLEITGDDESGVSSPREPHDEEIQQILESVPEDEYDENFCGDTYDCSISGPTTKVLNGSEFNGGGSQVTFDVSEGNITLVVDGDLETAGYTQWDVTGYESGHSVHVYTTGDLKLDSGEYATEGTDLGGFQPVNKWETVSSTEYHPEALTFYATEDATVETSNSVAIEGSISAPGAGTGSSFDLRMVGAIYLGSWDVGDASLNLYPAPGSYGRPTDDPNSSNGTMFVSVTANASGDPISGSTVEIYDGDELVTAGTTDDGSIEFDLEAGSYRLVADADGFASTNVSDVPVSQGGTTTVDVPLASMPTTPTSGTISGTVTNVSSGVSLDGAVVEATYAANDTIATSVTTNDTGQFSMELADGSYELTARMDDGSYDSSSVSNVSVIAGKQTDVSFGLVPHTTPPNVGSLSVTVVNGTDDDPISNADVQIEAVTDGATESDSTASTGSVTFDDLSASSEYVVTVEAPGYDSNAAVDVPINATGETTVTMPLAPEGYTTDGTPTTGMDSTALYYLHVSQTEIVVED